MLDFRRCDVSTPEQLDSEIRGIFSLDMERRSAEICGTLHIHYTDEAVKKAQLVRSLQCRGVNIKWHKKDRK